ncbi:MAG: hypothetical protein KKB37_09355 [Alphaproteobacteria bacterium]|nr:hypothetical protein [Alphaproteobacteria bacterium]
MADHHGSNGEYQKYLDEAIRRGHRHILLQRYIYTKGARSRTEILRAVNMASWDKTREGGLLYTRFVTGDHDHGLFWTIMFSKRANYAGWTKDDYAKFLEPIQRRHGCLDGRLYLVRNGLLGCWR